MSEELIKRICERLEIDVYRARGGKATIQWRDVPPAVRLAVEQYEASRPAPAVQVPEGVAKAMEQYARVRDAIDTCGDGGCLVKRPVGMHTNGGCKCPRDWIKAQRMMVVGQALARAVESMLAAAPAPATVATEDGAKPAKPMTWDDQMEALGELAEAHPVGGCALPRREAVAQGAGVDEQTIANIVREAMETEDYYNFPADFAAHCIRRALLSASPAGVGGWQPIETAPRDGTPIVGKWLGSAGAHYHFKGSNYGITAFNPEQGEWYDASEDDNEDDTLCRPDFWMPLEPPAIAKQVEESHD